MWSEQVLALLPMGGGYVPAPCGQLSWRPSVGAPKLHSEMCPSLFLCVPVAPLCLDCVMNHLLIVIVVLCVSPDYILLICISQGVSTEPFS